MTTSNADFLSLLNSVAQQNTFNLNVLPKDGQPVSLVCKELTTLQLKELVKTIVDSPLTQALFNSTVTRIFKESVVSPIGVELTTLDRLLFILETRSKLLSPTKTLTDENGEEFVVNFDEVLTELRQKFEENKHVLLPATSSTPDGGITIKYGVPSLDVEHQLNQEIYKDLRPNVNNRDEIRDILGEAFVNEIAKSLISVKVGETEINLTDLTFSERLSITETLPASLIQEVVSYIEKYKTVHDECLTFNDEVLTIDGALFTVR